MTIPGECAACAELGSCRLGLGELDGPPDAPTASAVCPPEFEGGPSTAHGGWTAALLDDFLGKQMLRAGRLSVTVELHVRYLRPAPVGAPLEVHGRVLAQDGDRWRLAADLSDPTSGRLLASAEGTWLERGPDHWERHQALIGRS